MSARCQAHVVIFDSVQGELLCPFFPENVCVAILPTNATLNLLSFSIATVKIAADIDGSGEVAISDVVSNLRHIVGLDTIEECALVDSTDALVTSLNSSTTADLTLVQYGDVDLSATFLIA